MSLILLNALLILVGPFMVVAPLALAAAAQLSPPRRGRRSYQRPAPRFGFTGLAVA